MKQRVLFIDRDGTLIEEPPDEQVDRLDKIRLVRGVVPALLRLLADGYRLAMVTNQDGLGTASFPKEAFEQPQRFILELFASQGISFDTVLVCPHREEDRCECRKPRTGLLTRYLAATDLDIEKSAVIGDRATDMELATNLGLRGFLIADDGEYETGWAGVADALCNEARRAELRRTTNETDVFVLVDLDSDGPASVTTGIGFFDHMLEQIARHAGFRLHVECKGDLHVDAHHAVEDTAICLGGTIRTALGTKRGIGRYGFLLPMDESEAQVSLDLGGRAWCEFDAELPDARVGELPTEMVPHFFRSLADSLGASLHVRVTGKNTHHMVEACFKALGRALRQAIRREGSALPSTKGVLA